MRYEEFLVYRQRKESFGTPHPGELLCPGKRVIDGQRAKLLTSSYLSQACELQLQKAQSSQEDAKSRMWVRWRRG